jgi:hypothetical protein
VNDLLVIVPSRGRPDNIRALVEAWEQTDTEATLMVAVDDDDPCLDEYGRLNLWETPGRDWYVMVGPRLRLGPTLNYYAHLYAPDYRHIGFMGDDHRPRTAGWDKTIVAALDELGTGVVYGNDLLQEANLPTAAFLTADIVRTLGYMVPPGLTHLFLDDFWKLFGERIGALRYLKDVVIEHLHPSAGKAEWDPGYQEANSGAMWDHDRQAWADYQRDQLAADVTKVFGGIQAVR